MKVLHMTLKKKWFDMIASGKKIEEYRELKKYWADRLLEKICCDEVDGHLFNIEPDFKPKEYDVICFRNGYKKDAPMMWVDYLGLSIGGAVPEWSDNWQGEVFQIKLGKVLAFGPIHNHASKEFKL